MTKLRSAFLLLSALELVHLQAQDVVVDQFGTEYAPDLVGAIGGKNDHFLISLATQLLECSIKERSPEDRQQGQGSLSLKEATGRQLVWTDYNGVHDRKKQIDCLFAEKHRWRRLKNDSEILPEVLALDVIDIEFDLLWKVDRIAV